MARVRDNIRKAGIIGRLVASDFSGALVSAIVLDQDAQGRPVDPIKVAHELERQVRQGIEGHGIDVRLIGFAKVMGDIADGADSVVLFAAITLVLTLLAVRLYCQSWRVALVPVIREMAITASIGVAIVILTDLVLLPVLVSYVRFDAGYRARVQRRSAYLAALWLRLSGITGRGPALAVIALAAVLGVLGAWKGRATPIGDTQTGVPELRPDSRYNRDNDVITSRFGIGVDVLTAIVESSEPVCVSHELMSAVDRFGWHMRNVTGVQDVITLPFIAKIAIAGWNEGSLKWRSIPREQTQLTQSTRYIETSTGLLNDNCDVVPVMMFLADHRAGTIERVVGEVKRWRAANPLEGAVVRLAAGNVGVMAATNETVKARELLILAGVFAAGLVMCLVTFRDRKSVV